MNNISPTKAVSIRQYLGQCAIRLHSMGSDHVDSCLFQLICGRRRRRKKFLISVIFSLACMYRPLSQHNKAWRIHMHLAVATSLSPLHCHEGMTFFLLLRACVMDLPRPSILGLARLLQHPDSSVLQAACAQLGQFWGQGRSRRQPPVTDRRLLIGELYILFTLRIPLRSPAVVIRRI